MIFIIITILMMIISILILILMIMIMIMIVIVIHYRAKHRVRTLPFPPPQLPFFLPKLCLRQTRNVTIRQSLNKHTSSLVGALHRSHDCRIMVVVDGDRWKLATSSSNVTHTKMRLKRQGASGSSVDPPPGRSRYFNTGEPSDHLGA